MRFQAVRPDDIELLDIMFVIPFMSWLWKLCWLFDEQNKDFREFFFDRVGYSGQAELVGHCFDWLSFTPRRR
jgi:hypothetical protein